MYRGKRARSSSEAVALTETVSFVASPKHHS
jgi:hypothetical protein